MKTLQNTHYDIYENKKKSTVILILKTSNNKKKAYLYFILERCNSGTSGRGYYPLNITRSCSPLDMIDDRRTAEDWQLKFAATDYIQMRFCYDSPRSREDRRARTHVTSPQGLWVKIQPCVVRWAGGVMHVVVCFGDPWTIITL